MTQHNSKTLHSDQQIHNFIQELFAQARSGHEVSEKIVLLLNDFKQLNISVKTEKIDSETNKALKSWLINQFMEEYE